MLCSKAHYLHHPRQMLGKLHEQLAIILYWEHPTFPLVAHAIVLQPHKLSGSHAIRHSITGKKNNQVLAGMLQYVQVTPRENLVERTVCPHELAVPLLDLLQARQAVAWLASLPAAERTGCRDLDALCCVTSALLGNLRSLATGT